VTAVRRAMGIAVPVAVVLLVGIGPFLVSDTYTLKLLTYAGVNVLVVVGLALLFGHAGQVSLGHAAFVGIGAYTCAYAGLQLKAPWVVAFAAAGIVSALGGLLLALPSLKLKGHYLAMATLGFGELASLAFKEAVPVTGGVNGLTGIPSPSIGPWELSSVASNYWVVWGVVGIAALVAANLTALRPGRAMRAIHGSEMGAAAAGVDVTGIKVRVFVVSAAMAGLAGALYASTVGFISPSLFSLQASVGFLAMAVIGGTGSLAGPMAAATALTLVQYIDSLVPGLPRSTHEFVQAYVPDVYGLAIVLVVLFAPGGLGSLWRRKAAREEPA
jgi:branched-chain amino acid transport system permease protein